MSQTRTRYLRQAPSGGFLGDPGLRIGPGSTGLIVRAHGDPTGDRIPLSVTATAYVPITGLTEVSADLQPGYGYQFVADYTVIGIPGTAVADCELAFALRDKSSQVWGDWQRLAEADAPWLHVLQGAIGRESQTVPLHDESQTVTVATAKDAVKFAIKGDGGFDWELQPWNTYVRIEEYLP